MKLWGSLSLSFGVAALALVASACGSDSGRRSSPPKRSSPAVAQVGSRSITRAQFDHLLVPALESSKSKRPSRRGLRTQVMRFLITGVWLEGEARERGIAVRGTEVDAKFHKKKREAFPDEASYRSFLEQTGQTEGDLRHRVKIDLLSAKIREDVTRGKSGTAKARAMDRFTRAFRTKWRERTVCDPAFAVDPYCGDTAGGLST